MKLMRFKDNTFMWISGAKDSVPSAIFSEKEAVAYGVWSLKIPKAEIKLGIDNLVLHSNSKKDNVAVFGDKAKIYLYTTKQGEAST